MNYSTVVFKIWMSFITLLLFNAVNAQAPDTKLNQQLAQIEGIMDSFTQHYDIPAMSIGISIAGKPYFINKGVYKRNTDQLMDNKGACQIASVSKMFTGAIVKALIAEGKIELNAPITQYLPQDYPKSVQKKMAGITIRDVLHHRSGIARDSKIANSKREGNDPLIYEYTEADFLTDFQQMRVKKNPKRKFEYSNFGYAVLGYIAERASGMSYEALLQKYIAEPYALYNTTTLVPDQRQRVTPYYKENKQRETQYFVMGKLTPPSAIFSTTEDLLKLVQAQVKVYQDKNKDQMLYLTQDARPESGPAYGYGLFRYNEDQYGHGGDIDGYASNYWLYPDKDLAYVFLTSSGGRWVGPFFKEIEAVLIDKN
ncbi:MAG: serine hydrolase domain-containing protein [Bacteroidota bacterium]